MEINKIYNENCLDTMKHMPDNFIDIILTSPPFNYTPRKGGPADKGKYDIYRDWKEETDYINWTVNIFKEYDRILKSNKVVLYHFSYSIENPSLPYKLVDEIINKTSFCIADTIIWKKSHAIPHPASYNRLNRIVEFIFVFCRKNEIKTFHTNKKVIKERNNGQKYYEVINNFIIAKSNDGKNDLNKATFSTDLCNKLLRIYAKKDYLVYDNFMGVGTTAKACLENGMNYIGSEISKEQCDYAEKILKNV